MAADPGTWDSKGRDSKGPGLEGTDYLLRQERIGASQRLRVSVVWDAFPFMPTVFWGKGRVVIGYLLLGVGAGSGSAGVVSCGSEVACPTGSDTTVRASESIQMAKRGILTDSQWPEFRDSTRRGSGAAGAKSAVGVSGGGIVLPQPQPVPPG